jgi:hypothetical protein
MVGPDMENEPYVITSISLVAQDKFLLELVEKSRLAPKGRREKWAERDSFYPGVDADDHVPSFLFGRSLVPITLQISAAEFNRLQLRIGQEVALNVVPIGA